MLLFVYPCIDLSDAINHSQTSLLPNPKTVPAFILLRSITKGFL